jgi:hypothetical protein
MSLLKADTEAIISSKDLQSAADDEISGKKINNEKCSILTKSSVPVHKYTHTMTTQDSHNVAETNKMPRVTRKSYLIAVSGAKHSEVSTLQSIISNISEKVNIKLGRKASQCVTSTDKSVPATHVIVCTYFMYSIIVDYKNIH